MECVTGMHLVARACGSTVQQWQHSQVINENRCALYEAGVSCTAASESTGDAAHMPLRWCERSPWRGAATHGTSSRPDQLLLGRDVDLHRQHLQWHNSCCVMKPGKLFNFLEVTQRQTY